MAVTNIVLAGLGGQGVVKASDLLSTTAFNAGFEVKKSEVHGMSQRGGSVTSDVRFGEKVLSPMVPMGEADFLLVFESSQVDINRGWLKPGGVLIAPEAIPEGALRNRKSLNVAILGALSVMLDFDEDQWIRSIHTCLAEKLHTVNEQAFALGREVGQKMGRAKETEGV
ncbi:indolepyruvate oxidoreductase [Ectothiorhodospira haloalkaliphila]|uniref:Indolepyruvate oxidoreductase n=1 Tax=Ectothiorhodospira haloalkaliphila TaxID=421628 RepID=W8KJR6_9GAMM|nr:MULTISPECIES: indolepyruvate oxidoreductase subunit beta [Ectothiorhodospira]AHK79408.1 indolepyruvate oxidoreductase [Ectothiorhodospira haloalkaliphila]MCG5493293.1 indolepyruvate oxidoreductase subunit beta [Ectothiorhodospira variabilis]MCG5496637.1 indolepyruvate oxidoreductase subunit beta [Ectothiorhodospira variabilis]MCG5502622.1 indolepyruvate oxidoreductase subunit beta [Ectothiorhodospira variabilis]MCG5505612.1 indolepyruvate oxidoreductase subunit beta [Ectothiorhodospira vari